MIRFMAFKSFSYLPFHIMFEHAMLLIIMFKIQINLIINIIVSYVQLPTENPNAFLIIKIHLFHYEMTSHNFSLIVKLVSTNGTRASTLLIIGESCKDQGRGINILSTHYRFSVVSPNSYQ
uniref:Uncharacterized protein n=1 Tax=Opuntia streptacantha TaxID=393608 RepID=A0A7C8ZW70_OPUST